MACCSLHELRDQIIACRRCPRLVQFRENVPPIPKYKDQKYWRKPVPGFGDPHAWLLITGLAPAANGGNRTGRLFTGDGTGKFLMKALFEAGFANQPFSESSNDGLSLHGCYLTAAVKCVPPGNKPLQQEVLNCHSYYKNELALLKKLTAVLVLGKLAFDAYLLFAKNLGHSVKNFRFSHGSQYVIDGLPTLYASYHPTPRNVNTGTLTEDMFCQLLNKIKSDKSI